MGCIALRWWRRPLCGIFSATVRPIQLWVWLHCPFQALLGLCLFPWWSSSAYGRTSGRQDVLLITQHTHRLQPGCGQTHSWLLPGVLLLLKKIIIYSLWYHTKEKENRDKGIWMTEDDWFPGQDSAHKLKGRHVIQIMSRYLSKFIWLSSFLIVNIYIFW